MASVSLHGFAWAQAQAQSDIYGRIVGIIFGVFFFLFFRERGSYKKKRITKGCFTCLRFSLSCQARMGKIHGDGGGYLFFLCSLLGSCNGGYLGGVSAVSWFSFFLNLMSTSSLLNPQYCFILGQTPPVLRGTRSRHLTNSLTQPGLFA